MSKVLIQVGAWRRATGVRGAAMTSGRFSSNRPPFFLFLIPIFFFGAAGHARGYTSAMSRAGPPVAPFTFAIPTTSVAPAAGTWSRLATFSRPQRPDGSHIWCVLKSFDGPLSSDNVSTASPATRL